MVRFIRFFGLLQLGAVLSIGPALLMTQGCDASKPKKTSQVQGTDPVIVDLPIAYVQRPIPLDEDGNPAERDVLDPAAFHPGAVLVVKDRASASARERIITAGVFPLVIPEDAEEGSEPVEPLYDVKDLSVSADGKKLLFAMRAPEIEDADDDEQPTWNIWEYNLADDVLRRVISSNLTAERGQDVSPHYLPDGRIIFTSTRQVRTRAVLLDETKPAYSGLDDKRQEESLAIHVMDEDGDNIQQLTYNVSQDLQPTLMSDGDVLFLRRDGIAGHNEISLYKAKPDGSDMQLYYGYHNQNTGSFDSEGVLFRPHEMPDGRILAILQPRSTPQWGGDLVAVDGQNYIDLTQPVRSNAGATGPAQVSLANSNIDTEGVFPSLGGYFNSAYPLNDNTDRLLVSWSQCRLINPDTELNAPCTAELLAAGADAIAAPLLFGLWIYDPTLKTQLPVKIPDEGLMYTDAVVISPRTPETVWYPSQVNPELVTEQVGVLHVRSVFDIDGLDSAPGGSTAALIITPPDARTVRFIRIVKNVPIPDDDVLDFDNAIFGRSNNQGMRDIIGYVPVEPDGSAKFKVPADIPFMLDLVDAKGKRVGRRHQNWLHLRPGEVRECTGCHTTNSQLPHGRRDAEAPSANPGALGAAPFPNTQLLDPFGTPQPNPEIGESMAEYYARINGPRVPSMDLIYTDEWTNPAQATPGTPISQRYVAVASAVNANPKDPLCPTLDPAPPTWQAPTACTATGSWTSLCRTTINYVEHIQPIWVADRRVCDNLGNVIPAQDHTCTSCHSRGPADAVVIPSGQLELTGEVSIDRNDYITSYAELMFTDNEQEVVDNSLIDVVNEIDTGEFERDANGDLILDANNNPIPIINLVTIPVDPPMSTNGAAASNRFFSLFDANGSHAGYLSADELKLIAEWLDIGGQYYNNPFDAPAN